MPVFFLVVMLNFTYTAPYSISPSNQPVSGGTDAGIVRSLHGAKSGGSYCTSSPRLGRGPGTQNPRYFNLSPPPKTSIASWAALSKHKNTLPIRTVQPPHLPTHSQCSTCIKCATALAGCQPLPKASRGEANSVTEWRRCPNPGNASLAEKDQSGRFRCLEPIKCGAGGRPRSLGSRWI